jgi:hypothetical protein
MRLLNRPSRPPGARLKRPETAYQAASGGDPTGAAVPAPLPWGLALHPTVHSFRTSGGLIATEEA